MVYACGAYINVITLHRKPRRASFARIATDAGRTYDLCVRRMRHTFVTRHTGSGCTTIGGVAGGRTATVGGGWTRERCSLACPPVRARRLTSAIRRSGHRNPPHGRNAACARHNARYTPAMTTARTLSRWQC